MNLYLVDSFMNGNVLMLKLEIQIIAYSDSEAMQLRQDLLPIATRDNTPYLFMSFRKSQ